MKQWKPETFRDRVAQLIDLIESDVDSDGKLKYQSDPDCPSPVCQLMHKLKGQLDIPVETNGHKTARRN